MASIGQCRGADDTRSRSPVRDFSQSGASNTHFLFVIFYRIEQQHHHPEKYINVVAFVEEEEKKGESRGGAQSLRVRVV